MNCYLDSSIVLRKILKQSQALQEWSRIRTAVSSRLLRLECHRTMDRLRLRLALSDEEIASGRDTLKGVLNQIGVIPVSEEVWRRAEQPFATALGSLDSIHLATAILWRDLHGDELVFATHDNDLALAARAHGFPVIGVS